VSAERHAQLEARVRRSTLPLIFVQAFSPDGSAASGAFISEQIRQIESGMNIAGVELTSTAALVGLVPDGVRSVSVRYEPHVTFSATVHDNVFVREIPWRFAIGSGDPAQQQTWKGRDGCALRTIMTKPDGTIIIYRPGHRRQIIPAD
jgi:hypothetical protein